MKLTPLLLLFCLGTTVNLPAYAQGSSCEVHLKRRFSDQLINRIFEQKALQRPEFRVFEVVPQVLFFQFEEQKFLTQTFVRMQEHYESPKFRGKIFNRKEFREWYRTTTKTGTFNYYSDWSGFNFPSRVVRPFLEGQFKNVNRRESQVLKILRSVKQPDFYVIGTFQDDEPDRVSDDERETLRHELAHALYYLDPSYRRRIELAVRQLGQENRHKLESYLKHRGYDESVFEDEIHAYLLTDLDDLCDAKRGDRRLDRSEVRGLANEIERLFENHLRRWSRQQNILL